MNMRKRKYYHDFNYEDRLVKLCLLAEEETEKVSSIRVGYSVRMPEDTPETEKEKEESEKLGKRIAVGRAESNPLIKMKISSKYAFRLSILRGIAEVEADRIKKGITEIKGIRNGSH